MKTKIFLRTFGLIFFLYAAVARGDGAFFPASVGVQTMPNLPAQRALIIHDGSTETLVVESMMNAPVGSDFTWILPLPEQPFVVAKGSPGALTTVFMRFGPAIISKRDIGVRYAAIALFLSLCIAGMILALDPKSRDTWSKLFFIVVIQIVLASMAVSSGPGSIGSTAQLLAAETVGNYDVVVLRGDSAEPIAKWFEANQFAPLNPASREAIDAYAREGWVFLAAKLHRTGTGTMTPHPLEVRFHTPRPIYPMRLTAAAGCPVFVKLAIYAKTAWVHPMLATEYADQMRCSDWYIGDHRGAFLEHPELCRLMAFDDGWLTVLSGTVAPDQMREDFTFKPMTSSPQLPVYYTPRAAMAGGVAAAIWLLTLGFPVIALIFKYRRRSTGKIVALALVLIVIVAGVCVWASAPIMPGARDVTLMGGMPMGRHAERMREAVSKIKWQGAATQPEVEKKVLEALKDERNVFTGEPLRFEQSPGNLAVWVDQEKGFALSYFDYECRTRYVHGGEFPGTPIS